VNVVSPPSVSQASSTTGNSKFYDNSLNSNNKNFSIKELPESVSPLSVSNISFSNISEEIGPIPPPRMFSDAVISTLQAAESNGINGHGKPGDQKMVGPETNSYNGVPNRLADMNREQIERSLQMVEPLIAQLGNVNLNMDKFLSGEPLGLDDYLLYVEDEWSSPTVEEVPAKEPQMSAVPKKSALKKPKNQNVYTASNAGPNGSNHLQSTITNGYVPNKVTLFY